MLELPLHIPGNVSSRSQGPARVITERKNLASVYVGDWLGLRRCLRVYEVEQLNKDVTIMSLLCGNPSDIRTGPTSNITGIIAKEG